MSERVPEVNHTLTQDLRINLQMIKLVQRLTPWLPVVLLMLALVEAAIPFVNLFLPAQIIDELLGARSSERLGLLIGITLALNFILSLTRRGLIHARTYQTAHFDAKLTQEMAMKTAEMDYYHAENPEIQLLRQMAYDGRNWMGGVSSQLRMLGQSMQDVVAMVVSGGIVLQLLSLPQIGGFGGLLGFIDTPRAALLLLATIIVSVILSSWINLRNGKLIFKQMALVIPVNRKFGYLIDLFADYRFSKDIRLFNMSAMLLTELREFARFSLASFWPVVNDNIRYDCISLGASTLLTGIIYLFVSLKALIGAISIGSIVLYVGAISQFNLGLSGLISKATQIRMCCLYAESYLKYLALPFRKDLGKQPLPLREDGRLEIEFRNVSFNYPGSEQRMLHNVSLKVNFGEKMAIVGMNGAGKTTFIKLLCRLYDPTEGEILLNGVDIRTIDYQAYLQLFSVVFQDFKLFAFPVGQNIAASLQVDEKVAWRRLEQVGAAERVRHMPQGINSYLYKNFDAQGIEVSGGEAQKIGIARALYKDAAFVILDEPTAALDPISEFEIYSAFDTLVEGKTAVYISHRLSSCRFCHDIVVFHEGRVIQRGDHETLLVDRDGKYCEMWNAQAQYYNEEKIDGATVADALA